MPIIYTFMNFPSIYILDTYGLKIGVNKKKLYYYIRILVDILFYNSNINIIIDDYRRNICNSWSMDKNFNKF